VSSAGDWEKGFMYRITIPKWKILFKM